MSARVVVQTQMMNRDTLLEALELLGVPSSCVLQTTSSEELVIVGYRGADWGRAEVLVRGAYDGQFGDVGFHKEAHQGYDCVIDHIDTLGLPVALGHPGREFDELVNQWYGVAAAQSVLRSQGLSPEIERDGNVVRVTARQY